MLKKCGKYMADWRDSKGVRHRAAFPTAAEAEAHQQRMRQAADRSCQLPRQGRDGDNRSMNANAAGASATGEDSRSAETASPGIPFVRGSMVVVTLGNPRDKFWGMILSLAPEGLSISGAELASFEDLVGMLPSLESAHSLALLGLLRRALELTRRFSPDAIEGLVMIHPAIKLLTGDRSITASRAADVVKRILSRPGADDIVAASPILRAAREKAYRLRPLRSVLTKARREGHAGE